MLAAPGKLFVVALCVSVRMPSKIKVRGPRVKVTAVIAVVPVMCTRLPVAVSRLIVDAEAMAVPVAQFCAAVNVLAPRDAALANTLVIVACLVVPDWTMGRTSVPASGVVAAGNWEIFKSAI
jgi:hypothetical protein